MIYEYALEPSLLNSWKDFRYFVEKFGVSQGRLISRYPKHWKRMVYESLMACEDMEKKKIEERLANIDDRMLKRRHEWNPELNWLANAELEHMRRSFHAIVARTNPSQHDFVLEGNEIDETYPLWKIPKLPIPRTAQEMAASVAPLLRACKEVLFVDPHFGPENPRYRRPLAAFLTAVLNGRDREPPTRVEIHLSAKSEAAFFQNECKRQLPTLIPEGMKVHLTRWCQKDGGEKLHNRFILTNMGGVRFGIGLDDGQDGETDEIELLGEETYKVRWAQYTSTPAFDLVDEVVIEGKKLV